LEYSGRHVGLDGKAGTHDLGEGDGMPTSGFQPGLVGKLVDSGEPVNRILTKTDVEESDQLGLTSFNISPCRFITMSNNDNMWSRMKPVSICASSVVHNVVTHGEDR